MDFLFVAFGGVLLKKEIMIDGKRTHGCSKASAAILVIAYTIRNPHVHLDRAENRSRTPIHRLGRDDTLICCTRIGAWASAKVGERSFMH
jgi:hypothetical protein